MANNPFFSGRIPQELFNHIEKRIQESGESKTDILIHALASYTGFDLPATKDETQSPLTIKVENLTKEVEALKDRMNSLEKCQKKEQEKIDAQLNEQNKTSISPISNTMSSLPLFADNTSDNNNDNNTNEKIKILNTAEATKLLRVGSNSTIPVWYKEGRLPKNINGFTINFDHKDPKKGYFWKLTPDDICDT